LATLIRDPKSGIYRIAFRHQGKQFTRSLRTDDERMAEATRGRVEETLALIATGRILMPQDAEPGTFILSDGKLTAKPKGDLDGRADRPTIGRLIKL
jgi:hypothetical protein